MNIVALQHNLVRRRGANVPAFNRARNNIPFETRNGNHAVDEANSAAASFDGTLNSAA
ncbi:MAG: hypothetical protein ACI9BW_000031 [Gammaproteobacteria bacterium]|jgi:hypothetical protein